MPGHDSSSEEKLSLDDKISGTKDVPKSIAEYKESISETISVEDIIAEPELQSDNFFDRHSKSLWVAITLLGCAAILGSGFLAYQAKQSDGLTVKTSYSAEGIHEPAVQAAPVMPIVENSDIVLPQQTIIEQPIDDLAVTTTDIKEVSKRPQKPETFNSHQELTKRVQSQLQTLGFYTAGINGYQTAETIAAIKTFQELYSLPVHGRMSGNFLSALVKADAQYKYAQEYTQGYPVIRETAPRYNGTVRRYNDRSTQYIGSSINNGVVSAPSLPTVEIYDLNVSQNLPPQTVQTLQDVVEAQRIRSIKPAYPQAALASNYLANLRIVVGYDIDPFGNVVNSRVLSSDHSGAFHDLFERTALQAINRQKFTAKTINGFPVSSTGKIQRIVFKAQ